jgi:eukaryotic-like serine/threonine-protein kinase
MTTVYSQIGKFEILRKLGRGGMADVYLAQDAEGQRQVALKVLEIGTDQDSQDALAAERHGAILQSRLCGIDPHVATVYEYGESDRFFFISMEHIDGDDLSTVLRLGPLVPGRAIDIAIEVCSLLVTAHALQLTVEGEPHRSVIHGDIKPRNIRIAPDGRVKVLDFGIAKALSLTRKLTRNDFGSVAYASPERLESGEVDVHSDLWSLGVVLYEMLAGRQPYLEATTRRLEEAIRSRRTPPPLPPSCPTAVQRVVSRALAPDLARRYPSATDFQADLIALRENRPTIADIEPIVVHDPDATRRTGPVRTATAAPDDRDATRRTAPVPPVPLPAVSPPAASSAKATAPAKGVAAATGAAAATKAAKPKRRSLFGRPLRLFLLFMFLMVAWREMRAFDAAARLRETLPQAERADMDDVWNDFRSLVDRSPFGWAVAGVKEPVRDRLIDFADRIIDSYRTDHNSVRERDWEEARTNLTRALSIEGESRVRARLRYADGHLARINGDARALKRAQEARSYYNDAVVAFEDAARLNSRWADPHLALARVYFYGLDDVDKGVEALEAAQKAGFKPGPRETAQRAEAYRRRGERLWRESISIKDLPQEDEVLERAAEADREALKLYARIIGYGDAAAQVTRTQRHLRTIEDRMTELEVASKIPW